MRPALLLFLCCLLQGCFPAGLDVLTVRDLGPLETADSIRGRDGGYSARVFERSVWLYGDSILAFEGEDGSAWRHNTASWTEDFIATDGLTGFTEHTDALGAPREFFEPTATEAAYNELHSGENCVLPCGAREVLWPGPLVWDEDDGSALVGWSKIHGEPGEWNFFARGSGWARWSSLDEPPVRTTPAINPEFPTLMFDGEERKFVAAALVQGDELYAFSCEGTGKACYLGRAPLASVEDVDTWTFWSGREWQDDRWQARALFGGNDMMSVHHDAGLGLYVAVYSEPLRRRVLARTSPTLTGPWSLAKELFQAQEADGDAFPYSGMAHPELGSDGVLYVSYYRATRPWEGELRLVEVEVQ